MKKRKVPKLRTDKASEGFLDRDLAGLDFSQFKPVRFEFEKKEAWLNMRLPEAMMRALKENAKSRGIPYQKFIRETLEQALNAQNSGDLCLRSIPTPCSVMEVELAVMSSNPFSLDTQKMSSVPSFGAVSSGFHTSSVIVVPLTQARSSSVCRQVRRHVASWKGLHLFWD